MVSTLIDSGSVRTLFQPLVDLGSGAVVGYEALSRGPAGHRLERPDLLFDAARAEGRLADLDWLCRATAFDAALVAGFASPLTLFVNGEPEVFDAPCPPVHQDVLARAVRGLRVVYEVTERALGVRPAQLLAEVERIRALGWGIAVDDVGHDWRSLALLPFIRPDVVKLDMSLVQGPLDDDGRRIARAVRTYASETGAQVLAEGIETDEHLARARELGATLAQGFLFGRPGPLPAAPTVAPGASPPRLVIDRRPVEVASPCEIVHPLLPTGEATKSELLVRSRAIEQAAAGSRDPCVLLGTFQQDDRFTPATRDRYAALAGGAAFVGAFGVGMTPDPAVGVAGARLADNDRLVDEWDVIVVGPHHAEALLARDLHLPGRAEGDRRFSYVHITDRALVIRAARSLMLRITPRVAAVDPQPAPATRRAVAGRAAVLSGP